MMVSTASITCASAALISGAIAEIFAAFDQDIAFRQVADLSIHADDGAAFEQNAALWIDGLLPIEAADVVGCGGDGKSAARGGACGQRGAGLERAPA